MAISDSQKVDYLYKKLGYGVAKTDTSSVKNPSNESIASPLLLRGDTVWVYSNQIPSTAPAANSSIINVYVGTGAIRTTNDTTASTNRTWLTSLTDWIGPEFGATYQPKVWAAPSGAANAAATGTSLPPDGSGNNDAWFFDPQSGVLNFSDTNVPTAVTGNVIYIEGYRYVGTKGLVNALGNITFTGSNISTNQLNANLTFSANGTGSVITSGNLIVTGNESVAGNLTANGLTVNTSGVFTTTLQAVAGIQATPIGNVTASTGQFTNLSATGNITGAALTSNGSITAVTTLSALGGLQATPIGNLTPSSALFTTLGASGNTTVSALTVNNTATIGSTLGVTGNINGSGITLTGSLTARGPGDFDGGLQSTPIGNAAASTGQFTTVSATGNITGAALTSNASITAITTISGLGGLQATPIGNVTPSTALFTTVGASGNTTVSALTVNGTATVGSTLGVTGNINGSGLTLTGSMVSTGPAQHLGGLQATPIGNAAPNTALFTTLGTSGNTTVSALTVNGTATIGSTLGVTGNINGSGLTLTGSMVSTGPAQHIGGLQATPIGNTATSTALFTTAGASGNVTANALTINNSATIGSTLGVTGNIVGANITVVNGVFSTVQAATIGNTGTNYTGSTYTATGSFNGPLNGTLGSAGGNSAIVSTLSGTGAAALSSLQVNNAATVGSTLTVGGLATLNSFYANTNSTVGANLTVVGNLIVSGNVITTGSNNTYFTDSIIELHTLPNLANLTFNDGKDIGIRFHFYKTQDDNAFLGWQNDTGYLEWLGSGATENINANIISGSYGTFKTGEIILANATPSTGLSTGALQVNGGASFSGNIYANGVAYFGNATAIALTNPLIVATTSANTYAQIQIQNQSNGSAASSDFIATADDGTDTTKFIDMGINSSTWNQSTWTVSGPRDGYLYTSGVNLTIGTDTVGKTLKIHTGGLLAACVVATFNDAGTVSSSSTTGALVLTGGLGVSGAINGGSTLGLVGNATVSGLAVNTSATIGTNLSVTNTIIAAYLVGDGGQLTNVGNITVANNSISNYYPVTFANIGSGPLNALNGGMRYNPSLGALAGLNTATIGTSITTSSLVAASLGVNLFNTTATTINLGGAATALNVGASNVVATFGSGTGNIVAGNITATVYGNSFGTTATYSGNATVNALTINNSATIGTTLGVTGNTTVGNILAGGFFFANGTPLTTSAGGTSGQVQFNNSGAFAGATGFTVSGSNVSIANLTINSSATIGTTLGVTGNVTAGNVSTAGLIRTTATTAATSNVTGAMQVSGGVGVAGNIYVGQRVGWVAANSVSAVYQIYNAATNSLDTIFG